MAVDLKLGAKIEASSPRLLGASPSANPNGADPTRHMYSVAADGRFLLRVAAASGAGAGGGSPMVSPVFNAQGPGAAAASARSVVTSGLTAVLHWASVSEKGSR
jgi:hypothetical protein